MRILIIALLGLFLSADPAAGREWADLSGTYRLQAELIGVADGRVRLRADDGRTFSILLDELSTADREFLGAIPTSADTVTTAWQPPSGSSATPPSSSAPPASGSMRSLFDTPRSGSGNSGGSTLPADRYPAAPPPVDRYPTTPPPERYPTTPPVDRYPTSPPTDLQPSSSMPSQTAPPASTIPPNAATPPVGQTPGSLPPLPGGLPPLPAEPNLPATLPPAPSQAPAPSEPAAPPPQSPAPPSAIQSSPAPLPPPQTQRQPEDQPSEESSAPTTKHKRIFVGCRSTFHLYMNDGTAAYWAQDSQGVLRRYLAKLKLWMNIQPDKFVYFKASGEGGITAWALYDEPRCGGGKIFAWYPSVGKWVFFDRDEREIPN